MIVIIMVMMIIMVIMIAGTMMIGILLKIASYSSD